MCIPGPVNDADRQGWQTQVAYAMHYVLYICFFALPLSGWTMWSAMVAPGPLYFAGLVPWTPLPMDELSLAMRWISMDVSEEIHHLLTLVLGSGISQPVPAALKHPYCKWN